MSQKVKGWGIVLALLLAIGFVFNQGGAKPKAEPVKTEQTELTAQDLENKRKAKEQYEAERARSEQLLAENKSQQEEERAALDVTKNRIKAYLNSLPGAGVVIVSGSPAVIVECDYDFGTADKETAKSYATDLIYDIMDASGSSPVNLISVNCMNGKTPIGIIVNYEDGRFYTLP